jgi:hypothetical protein
MFVTDFPDLLSFEHPAAALIRVLILVGFAFLGSL